MMPPTSARNSPADIASVSDIAAPFRFTLGVHRKNRVQLHQSRPKNIFGPVVKIARQYLAPNLINLTRPPFGRKRRRYGGARVMRRAQSRRHRPHSRPFKRAIQPAAAKPSPPPPL